MAHRLVPPAGTVVDPGENLTIPIVGLSNFDNSLCQVVLEYLPPG